MPVPLEACSDATGSAPQMIPLPFLNRDMQNEIPEEICFTLHLHAQTRASPQSVRRGAVPRGAQQHAAETAERTPISVIGAHNAAIVSIVCCLRFSTSYSAARVCGREGQPQTGHHRPGTRRRTMVDGRVRSVGQRSRPARKHAQP